jgi:hypothetical protein
VRAGVRSWSVTRQADEAGWRRVDAGTCLYGQKAALAGWLAGWLSVYDLRKQSDKTTFVTHLLEHVPEGR